VEYEMMRGVKRGRRGGEGWGKVMRGERSGEE
jgi:hypothetical protein